MDAQQDKDMGGSLEISPEWPARLGASNGMTKGGPLRGRQLRDGVRQTAATGAWAASMRRVANRAGRVAVAV